MALSASLQADADAVKNRVKASKTSFAAGMGLLPKPRREAMYALYAFCREVDDIADDLPTLAERQQGLAMWRHRIARLFQARQASDPITVALLPAIAAYGLVAEDFLAVIDGMDMDAGETPVFAPSLATLDLYCDRVASAVGRASVRIFGDDSPAAMQVAHHLGRALQLTNILRDLAEDMARGRLYLPKELLERHGIASESAPAAILKHPALPALCREIATQAQEHYTQAHAAMARCNRAAMRPARIMGGYYRAILDRLVAENWRDPSRRVRLPSWQKLWLVLCNL